MVLLVLSLCFVFIHIIYLFANLLALFTIFVLEHCITLKCNIQHVLHYIFLFPYRENHTFWNLYKSCRSISGIMQCMDDNHIRPCLAIVLLL